MYEEAAAGGHVNILQWLFDNEYPLDSVNICLYAARHGQLPALQWLLAHGCPISVYDCLDLNGTKDAVTREFLYSLPQ
jgi:hypothetical protein